ncbi:hypothetical protein BH10PSE7_BH10PSE7_15670 [soil metagenome]
MTAANDNVDQRDPQLERFYSDAVDHARRNGLALLAGLALIAVMIGALAVLS